MPDTPTIKDYDIHVYWDSRAEYFVAEIPEILTCAADGPTQAEAISNLEETFAVLKEAYAEEGYPFPKPSPQLPISVQELSALSEVIKISRVAELSGIPGQTIATKLKRGTQFNIGESRRIARTLLDHGLMLRSGGFGRNLETTTLYPEQLEDAKMAVREPDPKEATGKRARRSSSGSSSRRKKAK